MNKVAVLTVVSALTASAFIAGVAVGKAPPPTPKFTAAEEVKWDDINGVKLATLFGDTKKGPYGGLFKIPAGHTSPLHSRSGAYEAVQISGTSSHWLRGEDGSKAKKMTPGSYWTIPGKLEHVSSCAAGAECVLFLWQKTKFDFAIAKDAAAVGSAGVAAGSGAKATSLPSVAPKAGAGSAAPAPKAGAGSAAVPAAPKAGAGSAAAPAAPKAGAGSTAATAPKAGAGIGSGTAPKK